MRFEIDMLIEHYVKKGSALYHIESNTITPVNRLHFDLRQIFRISSVFTTGTPHINIFVNRERLYDLITSLNNVFFYVWEPKDETEKAEMKRDFKTYLKRGQSGYDEVAALLKLHHKKPQEVKRLLDMLTNILGKIDRDSSPATLSNIINDDMIKALLEEYKRNSESVERFLTMLTEIGQTLGIVEFDLLERFLILKDLVEDFN